MKNCFSTSTAWSESNTAEKLSAAIMIHRNIAELFSVSLRVLVKTFIVRRFLKSAIRNAASAPTAELSSREVSPLKNDPMTLSTRMIGRMPARRTLNFSAQLKLRCSFGSTGPSFGLIRQRITT